MILITCIFYSEIYEQLKKIQELKDIECYMYNCICSYPDLDIEQFFENEVKKQGYKEYKQILKDLNLKDKYKGKRCFVIGNGPSLRAEDLELIKNEITFAANRINVIFSETSWRPTYYFCVDYLAYGADHEDINRIDSILRFVPKENALVAGKVYDEITYYDRYTKYVDIKDGKIIRNTNFEFSDNVVDKTIGGYTVLYDMPQFAVYMGFQKFIY